MALTSMGISCSSLHHGRGQTQLLLMVICLSLVKGGLLTMRQGRCWCSSAQPCFTCHNRHLLGDPAGPHSEEQEMKDPKTLGKLGLLLPLDFWPSLLPHGKIHGKLNDAWWHQGGFVQINKLELTAPRLSFSQMYVFQLKSR